MRDRGEWIQLIFLLVVVGGGIVQWLIKQFWSKSRGAEPGPQQRRSPAIQLLEKLRAESERTATGGSPLRAGDSPAPGAIVGNVRSLEQNQADEAVVYDDGSDDEDPFFGDDDLAGQRAIREDSARRRAQRRSSPAPSHDRGRQGAQRGAAERGTRRPARMPPQEDSTPVPQQRRVLRATQTRKPREQVLHPRTEHLQQSVEDPRTQDEHVEVYTDLDLDDTASDLGVSQLPLAEKPRQLTSLIGLFDATGMDLRRAMIGQIVLGPPKSLEGRR